MKKIILLLALSLMCLTAFPQVVPNIDWVKYFSERAFISNVPSAIDANNNVYITGYTYPTTANSDITTVKYDAAGNVVWVKHYDNGGNDDANGIKIDASGNIFIVGESDGTGTGKDLVIIKYDANGNQLFATRYNGTGNGNDIANAISLDGTSSAFVTGKTTITGGTTNYVTLKFNANTGAQQWVSFFNGTGNNNDESIAIDFSSTGRLFITGNSRNASGNDDITTIRLNPNNGNQVWAKTINGTANNNDRAYALLSDGNDVVTVGSLNNLTTTSDYLTIKYNGNNGNTLWQKNYDDGNSANAATSIVKDASNNFVVTGLSLNGSIYEYHSIMYNNNGVQQWVNIVSTGLGYSNANPQIAVDPIANHFYVCGQKNTNVSDILVYQITPTGNKTWEETFNGAQNNQDAAVDLVVNSQGVIYVAGASLNSNAKFDYTTIRISQTPVYFPVEQVTEQNNISYLFYENKGQVTDVNNVVEQEVTHSTMDVYPTMFFKPTQLSYKLINLDTLSNSPDTTQRIDINLFEGNKFAKAYSFEPIQGQINIFDSKLPVNSVTDIQGYKRTMIPNVYNGIDLHYYSNSKGIKIYYVVKPTANPNLITWIISGANSTALVGNNLEIQGINAKIVYDQPNIYQVNMLGQPISLSTAGAWQSLGIDKYNFKIPTYNPALPLIIELDYGNGLVASPTAITNLEFCTFYGGALDDDFKAMKTNAKNGNYVVVGTTKSWDVNHVFPTGGTNTSNVPNTGTTNLYMTAVMFDSIGRRLCSNIFGGGSDFIPSDLVINDSTNAVTIVGNAFTSTLPTIVSTFLTPGAYTNSLGQGFVVQFEPVGTSLSRVKWKSRLNGYASGIAIKPNTKEIYITSATKSTSFAADLTSASLNPNAYNFTTASSKWHFQVSKFDAVGVRKWATYFPAYSSVAGFGGNATNLYYNASTGIYNEQYLKCHIDCDKYGFTIAGEARDTGLVIFNKYNRAIDSTYNGLSDAFVTRFNSNDSLVFSQYIGGSKNDGYHDLKYASPNSILLTGYSQSPEYKNLTYRSSSTQYVDTVMPTNATKMLISKIDSTGSITWSTFYGNGNGAGESCLGWSITSDITNGGEGTSSNKLFVTGVASNSDFKIATSNFSGVMNNTSNLNIPTGGTPGYADAFMLSFTQSNTVAWNTYFGGSQNECGLGLEYNSYKDRMMITGLTNTGNSGSSWPKKFPTTYTTFNASVWYKDALNASTGSSQIYAGYADGYIGWFNVTNIVGIQEYFKDNTNIDAFNLYPNPTNGDSYIAFKNKLEGQTLIEIYSITGQLVYSNLKNNIFEKSIIELPTYNLSNGMYIVNVKNENNSFSKKLMISK
jgi:hypothetical protein